MDEMDSLRVCPVGLLTNDHYDNVSNFIHEATEAGHDFVATPIAQPRFGRVLGEDGIKNETLDEWRDSPHFERDDLILKSAGRLDHGNRERSIDVVADWADAVVGILSDWYRLDTTNELHRVNSELALKQELAWACHLGLLSVILPGLPKGSLSNTARAVGTAVMSMSYTQMWIRLPLTDNADTEGNLPWHQWNRFRALTDHNPKIHVALELTADLPSDDKLLDMWLSEPIKAVIIPAETFVSNAKGFPVLSKRHQAFVKTLMHKLRPNVIVTMPTVQLHPAATPSSYQEYIRFLNRNLPELDDVERFAVGYQDYLQAPLQPLMDNLDNQTYETFEKDPIKYQQYEKAVYHALLDRVEYGSDYETVIMVVGAGRGPLVNCCLRASEKAERKIHIYAIEKNPNAFVTLQNAKADVWQDRVTLVFADMRKWKPSRKCDILVSELLGSFGDNELSPECLDGAQKFLKSFISPMASTKLYNEVAAYKDLTHFETPYVVMFQQVCELARSKPLWVFEHPNTTDVPPDSDPINNLHNVRYQQVEFEAQHDMTMHGLAGYFESILYKDVMISIHPETHSPGMFSWFPIFFPIKTPIQVSKGSLITVDIWRQTDLSDTWLGMSKRLWLKALFSRHAKESLEDEKQQRELRRTESTSSYMQQRRKIYINMELPSHEYDDKGRLLLEHYPPNRVRTAKYTPLTFIPKNLFEQFRNVANLYFLFLVILQCIPIFGVTEPAVSALPLIAILVITAIKDGVEDWKRNQSDQRVNHAKTLTLSHWSNVNMPSQRKGRFHFIYVCLGFIYMLAGVENRYTQVYRQSKTKPKPLRKNQGDETTPLAGTASPTPQPSPSSHHADIMTPAVAGSKKFLCTVRQRSDTLRSELSNIFKPAKKKIPYRPGAVPHSVLYRMPTNSDRRPSTIFPPGARCAELPAGDPPAPSCKVAWEEMQWQDIKVGDYIMICDEDDVPADIVILSSSETDNLAYVETQNLDGETNLKARQGLNATSDLRSVHDCERARFYIECEPPHANIYQFNGVLRWDIEHPEDNETTVSHQKTEAITYNNLLLRGCVLRNTKWVIGVVVYTGDDTKIMLNAGKTPSKRSKMAKATNPHVIANFCILAVICILSSVLASVQFNASASTRYFDFGIEGTNAAYAGFLTFWVTLILYQNIVPISLYISVEIVKTFAAYFIFADVDMYYEKTDTPCIPRTWNISDDLGQIEYIFSDKTGTLTQNVMEFRKCTINGVAYGLGTTEATLGAKIREHGEKAGQLVDSVIVGAEELEEAKVQMLEKRSRLFKSEYVGSNLTFVDPKFFDDLQHNDSHATALTHFYSSLALCHTVIAERPDKTNENIIEYKAQSPDEAALVATARDLGFVFLGRKANNLETEIMGELRRFKLLNVLEFNSSRKRMSVIVKPQDSDRIVLLCKGADSVIFERLCTDFGGQTALYESQEELKRLTNDHLEEFANEGLRTLCLAYRFISPEEYEPWNKRYQEASSSIYGREEKLDEICEEIECKMLLMGGTAIEDRLQDGVPETIAELSQSGIKLWILTGDKTETAINIGYTCNLITNDMELLVLRAHTREDTVAGLKQTLESTANEDKKRALVIDGTTLKYALEPKNKHMTLALGMRCASVICCRVSPKQKAQVVLLVKKGLKVMTLAIGDGANDVSMIQAANVGVGISGVEGRQAVMASDYAIAQFRFLQKLLLVHGRWSYLRTAQMIMGFFFKNIVWTLVLFWYQIYCQFNGTMMFDYALITLYNLIFTSLPIIFLGIWDQDISAKISLQYPQLYRMGLRNDKFKVWQFWLTCFDGLYQSAVCFFFPYMLILLGGAMDPHGYDSNGVYEIGTIVSSITVIVANLFVSFSLYSYTWIQLGIIGLSILVYYAFVCIYAQFNTFIFAGQSRLFAPGVYWLSLILTIVASFLPRVVTKYYLHQYHPYDNDIIREIELVLAPKGDSN
ncbi:hypothetical protein EC973_007749 [Apophysomyces ossiformis]|uniref:P-type phospholipid transporter n=1 Tax=Apophysomyces ossiformis TaxID=679940 RepID=A0A8H7BYT2_9FUNG|nr:hypothetical protein EC973_007749 [Apophysomyces ossiformis]